MAKPSQFRLSPGHLALLDGLAASHKGVRSDALRDAIAHWHRAVSEAGALNAAELTPEDWERLAQLNDPGPIAPPDDDDGPQATDWSARLAHELAGAWEGRRVVLDLHRQDRDASYALARRIAGWGHVRGYALWAALRYFWTHPDAGVGGGDWWAPEVFLEPTAAG